MEKLEVDCFEIDIELLNASTRSGSMANLARFYIMENIIANLTQESKKIFEEYQEKNTPCKGEK